MSRKAKVLIIAAALSLSSINFFACNQKPETYTKYYYTAYMSNNITGKVDTLLNVRRIRGIKNHVVDFHDELTRKYSMGTFSYRITLDSTVTFESWGGSRYEKTDEH